MPELPEVETIKNTLAPKMIGAVIKSIFFWEISLICLTSKSRLNVVKPVIVKLFLFFILLTNLVYIELVSSTIR